MPVSADALRRLADLRLSPDAMAVVLGIIADVSAPDDARRAKDAERKRSKRASAENPRTIHGQSEEIPRTGDGPSRAQVVILPVEEKKEGSLSLPSEARPLDDLAEAVEAYNSEAAFAGWPKAERVTTQRRSALKARLAECGGIEPWRRLMARARASPFLTGSNDRGWLPNLDFFLQAKSFTKLTEGAYDGNRTQRMASAPTARRSGADALMAALAAAVEQPPDRGLVHGGDPGGDFAGGPILDLSPAGETRRMGFGG